MRILVTNDDGVHAPGLHILAEALRSLAEVVIVAPDRDRSAASNSLSVTLPVRVQQQADDIYSVQGTPTDCVHLAITGLLPERPDMVVSGINNGANLGDDVLYSGTVAAAMEGRFLGLPAVAVSLVGHNEQHYHSAAAVVKSIVTKLQRNALPASTILNVNVPDKPLNELGGIELVRLGSRHNAENVIKASDPRGRPVYWIGPPGPEQDAGPGTDFYAINQGRVTITPLQLDLTHYRAFEQIGGWLDDVTL